MTPAGARPALAAGWADALRRGFLCFLALAGLGQALALSVWALGGTGQPIGTLSRIGWLYFGAFHHVAVEVEAGDLAVGFPEPSTTEPTAGSLSVGVALLAATALAAWLLFRAGRGVADRVGGTTGERLLHGAKVAVGYAVPAFVVSLPVEANLDAAYGPLSGSLRAGLSPWQALVLPLAIAGIAGAAGGLGSAVRAEPERLRLAGAALEGGWRMFVLGLALSLGGLFVAGVVQPEEPVALLTPSSARYYREAFDRPRIGALVLAHHVGLTPNEALWTLVPAMGGCDGVWGSAREDFLCYGRFPLSLRVLPPGVFPLIDAGDLAFRRAPVGYFLFLLVPTTAAVLGGRHAAKRARARGREAALAGVLGGVVFAALVAATAVLATVTVQFDLGESYAGRALVGPNLLGAPLLALGWGAAGGAIGAVSGRAGTGPAVSS